MTSGGLHTAVFLVTYRQVGRTRDDAPRAVYTFIEIVSDTGLFTIGAGAGGVLSAGAVFRCRPQIVLARQAAFS